MQKSSPLVSRSLHPIVFLPLFFQWGIYFFLKWWLAGIYFFQQTIAMTGWTLQNVFLLALFAWLVLHSIGQILRYLTTRYLIFPKKLVTVSGWLARSTTEVLLAKIESVQVRQTICGRLLGYGTLYVQGTGGLRDPMHFVPGPMTFRDKIYQQIHVRSSGISDE